MDSNALFGVVVTGVAVVVVSINSIMVISSSSGGSFGGPAIQLLSSAQPACKRGAGEEIFG